MVEGQTGNNGIPSLTLEPRHRNIKMFETEKFIPKILKKSLIKCQMLFLYKAKNYKTTGDSPGLLLAYQQPSSE